MSFLLVDPTEITRPGPFEELNLEWWHVVLFIALWVIGFWFNSYIRKNKYK